MAPPGVLKSTSLAHQTQDDGFHEIQLNGKQLVFLFMAATVVSVVIFLCGVLVGRGVRGERGGSSSDVAAAGGSSPADVLAEPAPATPPATAAGSDPTAAAPPAPAEDLSYYDRLEKKNPPKDELKKEEPKAATPGPLRPRAAAKAASAAPAPAAAVPVAAAPPAAGEPAGPGYAVQIAALNVRGEADAIAKRLMAKGYAAYVLAPPSGTPTVFRVRVGKFKTRREAETVAAKLKKEEQFAPWITR